MIEGLIKVLRAKGVDPESIGSVFDIGSRDGLQSLELSRTFPSADIVAVECNPTTLDLCRRNVARNPRIRLVEKAINDYTGRCAFHPIDTKRTVTTWPDGNPGASSLFVATGDYPIEKYVQNRIEVDCTRLDDLCKSLAVDTIDLIWMDLQGAELLALKSAGPLLDKVRYIYTEVSHRPLYSGQCMFDDIESYLTARGFRRLTAIDRQRWQQDAIYENARDLIDVMVPFTREDSATADISVRSIRSFVGDVRHIFLVGDENPRIDGTRFMEERSFPFDAASIARANVPEEQVGETLRQLIKLYFPRINRAALDPVLCVDPDTVFFRPCRFLEDGRPVVNFGDAYHEACFAHMSRLLPELHRMFAYSGICHSTLFKRSWLEELHERIEAHHDGRPLWQAYLEAFDAAGSEMGASEQEIYFNFCLLFHAQDLTIRRLRWIDATRVGDIPQDQLDYVNLHRRSRTEPVDRSRLAELVSDGSKAMISRAAPPAPREDRSAPASKPRLLEKLWARIPGASRDAL